MLEISGHVWRRSDRTNKNAAILHFHLYSFARSNDKTNLVDADHWRLELRRTVDDQRVDVQQIESDGQKLIRVDQKGASIDDRTAPFTRQCCSDSNTETTEDDSSQKQRAIGSCKADRVGIGIASTVVTVHVTALQIGPVQSSITTWNDGATRDRVEINSHWTIETS